MPKPFMTYAQQIQKMKDKHLLIPDEAAAETALRTIGYFSLVSGYKDLFKNPTTRDYRVGIRKNCIFEPAKPWKCRIFQNSHGVLIAK